MQTHTFPSLIDFPLMSCLRTPVSGKAVLYLPPHLALITSQINSVGYTLDPLPILKVYRKKVKFMVLHPAPLFAQCFTHLWSLSSMEWEL